MKLSFYISHLYVLFEIRVGSGWCWSSNGSICKKRLALHGYKRWLFSQSVMMIKLIDWDACITDRFTELCIRWRWSFAVLMGRVLFVIMVHANGRSATVSPPNYTMGLTTGTNAISQTLFGRILDPNGILLFSDAFLASSQSVDSFPTNGSFLSLS